MHCLNKTVNSFERIYTKGVKAVTVGHLWGHQRGMRGDFACLISGWGTFPLRSKRAIENKDTDHSSPGPHPRDTLVKGKPNSITPSDETSITLIYDSFLSNVKYWGLCTRMDLLGARGYDIFEWEFEWMLEPWITLLGHYECVSVCVCVCVCVCAWERDSRAISWLLAG